MFLSFGRFDEAVEPKSQEEFDAAVKFMHSAMGAESASQMLPMFEKQFEAALKR